MPKKKSHTGKPQVNKDLEGYEIQINEFGEIISNFNVDKLNNFLNKNVADKKLKDRKDLDKADNTQETEPKID